MTTVQTFTEQEAKWSRRAHIESGHPVSLIGYNPDTISDNVDTYAALSTQLKAIRVWVPLVGGILGLLLLIVGAIMLRRRPQEPEPA